MGGFVAQAWGYQWVFIVFGILTFLCFLISYFRLPETRVHLPLSVESHGHHSKTQTAATRTGVRPLLRDASFVLISLAALGVIMMRVAGQNQILPLLGQERMGLSSGQIGIAMTVTVIFQFIAMFVGGRLSDRFGRKIIITPGCLIGAFSLLVLSQSYTFEMLLLSCIGTGIGVGMAGSTALAYVADITPQGNYDTSMGLYRTITDLSFVIGPVLMGWLADTGGFTLSLLFNSVFLFVLVIIFQIFARGRVKKS
jgi:MFS family permease